MTTPHSAADTTTYPHATKEVVHRTRAPERSVILMVETANIIPTGD